MPEKSGGGSVTRTIDEQFLALVCSDEDLLQAEFDAIIAAEWAGPSANTPRHETTAGRPAAGAHLGSVAGVAGVVARPQSRGISDGARQRSPPTRGEHD